MIRPVSHQQMQLQSPRKPRNNALSPSSPMKNSSTTAPKSPIKKHLQNASAFALETSSVVATTASDELNRVSSPRHGPLKAKLRASVLQAVLKLLDQDANALTGAHEVLQAAAALPLAEPNVQRACMQALRGLHKSNVASMPPSFVYDSSCSSNSNWDETPVPPSPRKQAVQQTRTSGRAKSLTMNSLHHCKKFLLACANEIHELEDDHPVNFDYAEDTASSKPSVSMSEKMCKHCGAANFDYASTVQESSDAFSENESCSDDDTRADQGSQFSEVLHRAEFMSDVGDDEVASNRTMSMKDRVVCRKVLRALHEHIQSQRVNQRRRSTAPNLAMKFRVFEALKLQASLTRKRISFQQLRKGIRMRHQQNLTSTALVKSRSAQVSNTTFQTLMLHHSDVLLLLLALVFLANLPAKYIM